MAPAPSSPVVLYDGVCGLCHRAVHWLLAHEVGDALRYAPLQGETAAALRARHPEIPRGLDSIAFVEEGRVHLRSKAFLHLARYVDRPWRWAYGLRWLPGWLLDPAYHVVARLRYAVFGKKAQCEVPRTERRTQLLP